MSSKEIDYSRVIPEDVLAEIIRYEGRSTGNRRKTRYPSARDIVEAVIAAASRARGIHPDEFPGIVYDILNEQGYDTRFVTVKRIWRTYESLVYRGVIRDVLGVVKEKRRHNG